MDIEKLKMKFEKYLTGFDLENRNILRKQKHTYRTVEVSRYLTKGLGLGEEDVILACFIALLHDIGRFEQEKRYSTFEDLLSIDHAEFGADLLFKQNLIRDFIREESFDYIIEKAIREHNKYKIDSGISGEVLLHVKLIRDADKLDNFFVKLTEPFEAFFKKVDIGGEKLSDEVYQTFLERKAILNSVHESNLDKWIKSIACVFDLNFQASFQYIQQKDYINQLFDKVNYRDQETIWRIEKMKGVVNAYIEEKIRIGEERWR